MEAGRHCRTCRLRPPPSVFWFLFHAEKELAPQGETLQNGAPRSSRPTEKEINARCKKALPHPRTEERPNKLFPVPPGFLFQQGFSLGARLMLDVLGKGERA